ncbi:survival motor neuron protein-like [Daphnia carinata]|uniref:survival motor neuron protein-like n=1 Tax=Daphnia carinata TaxID=120202 RepID=UPI00257F3160|nr:survival motor neuron protein-like [Daphnia carinata]
MEENNFLLFKRDDQGQDSHEDVWDDTALIQAYDRAVNLAKERVASQLSLEDGNPKSTTSDVSDEEQSESPSKSTKKWNWGVGEDVRSVYSEDGKEYEATIMKINQTDSSCLIKYLGYENEEVVFLRDLKPSAGVAARKQQIIASRDYWLTAPESSSDMEQECEVLQPPLKPQPMAGLGWQPAKPEPSPKFPGMSNMSSIPPPPPPTAWPTHGTAEMDSDSLYSMLMSWYMAGYHTGYYQGVQQRNKRKANGNGT